MCASLGEIHRWKALPDLSGGVLCAKVAERGEGVRELCGSWVGCGGRRRRFAALLAVLCKCNTGQLEGGMPLGNRGRWE